MQKAWQYFFNTNITCIDVAMVRGLILSFKYTAIFFRRLDDLQLIPRSFRTLYKTEARIVRVCVCVWMRVGMCG